VSYWSISFFLHLLLSTIDHCGSRCKGWLGPPFTHTYTSYCLCVHLQPRTTVYLRMIWDLYDGGMQWSIVGQSALSMWNLWPLFLKRLAPIPHWHSSTPEKNSFKVCIHFNISNIEHENCVKKYSKFIMSVCMGNLLFRTLYHINIQFFGSWLFVYLHKNFHLYNKTRIIPVLQV
jgi:hypothetical protein